MKGRKTGGRVAGTPNKRTQDIQALAAKYCGNALKVLETIQNDAAAPAAARVSAANSLLDRGYGKPAQAVTGPDGGPVAVTVTVNHVHIDGDN